MALSGEFAFFQTKNLPFYVDSPTFTLVESSYPCIRFADVVGKENSRASGLPTRSGKKIHVHLPCRRRRERRCTTFQLPDGVGRLLIKHLKKWNDMKKLLFVLIAVLLGTASMFAQDDNGGLSKRELRKQARAARKAEKEAQKQAEIEEGKRLFEMACRAVDSCDFVLEAEKIEFRSGQFVYVNSSTNFVSLHGKEATIQLAFNIPISGPNGMGGITVDGTISKIDKKKDRRGNMMYEMMVQGIAVSANVVIHLTEGTNDCRVTVMPNFNNRRISFIGHLYPSQFSRVFKGRSI